MTRFPKGTVTFLCARQSFPAADHAAQLPTAIINHGGLVFYADDLTIQSVFSSSTPALEAALQANRHIRAAAQNHVPGAAMALHTGPTHEHEGRYFGPTLNRVLSMLAAGHPGQVLLSASAHDALHTLLPTHVQLRALGEYRLKDLFYTEQLYQVVATGLLEQFPPLNTLDMRPHNLPIQDSPLIGREQEVASTCALLGQPALRLLTLLGSSGMGKTRLALQLAVEVIDDFPDGVYFVALAPVNDPDLLVSMIAQVLGIKEQAGQPLLETLVSALRGKKMLLVLDNFEQLWAAAPTISQLLVATQDIKVLVTSQMALELAHERVFAVPPLAMPDPAQHLSLVALSQIPAVALFVERARQVYPSFTLTELIAPALIELCNRLEGLPLAIELVAAQSKRYFPGDMLMMLQNRLSVARTIRRGNTREDTLRPVLDWICELLGAGVAGLFARLGVFAGGCTSESAQAICNQTNDLALDVEKTLAVLLENHLLLREELKQGHVRYTMLDAIHDYARQRLTRRREIIRMHTAHASYYTTLAQTAEPLLKGSEQEIWLARLEDEHHNLRAALTWSSEHSPALAVTLSAALGRFWYIHGHFSEGRHWLQSTSDQSPTAPPADRARALHGLGVLAYAQGEYSAAASYYAAALALRRELDDTAGIVSTLNNLGILAGLRGDHAQATSLYEECLPLWRAVGDSWGLASSLNNLGGLAFDQADYHLAERYYHAGLALREQLGDTWGRCSALFNLGRAAHQQGDHKRAAELLSQSLNLARDIDDERMQAEILEAQAWVSMAEGDLAASHQLLVETARIRQKQGEKYGLVLVVEAFAALLVAQGQPDQAPTLLGAAALLREAIGTPFLPLEQSEMAALRTKISAQIGLAAFDAAWQAGARVAFDDLVDTVLRSTPPDH